MQIVIKQPMEFISPLLISLEDLPTLLDIFPQTIEENIPVEFHGVQPEHRWIEPQGSEPPKGFKERTGGLLSKE